MVFLEVLFLLIYRKGKNMEFSLLRKISAYSASISLFLTTILNFIFLIISGYLKYIKKNKELLESRKIKNLEKVSFKSQLVAVFLIILFIVVWWESLSY